MPTPIGFTRDPDGLYRFHFDDGARVPAAGGYAEDLASRLPDLGPSMASRGVAMAGPAPARDFGDVDAVPVDLGDVDASPRDAGDVDAMPYTGHDFTPPASTVPAMPRQGVTVVEPVVAEPVRPVMATGAAGAPAGQPGAAPRGPTTVDLVDQDMLARQRAGAGGGGVIPAHEVDVVSPKRAADYIAASTDVAEAQAREADARATAHYAQAGAIQQATQDAEVRHLAQRVRAATDARDRQAAEDEIKAAHGVKVDPHRWWDSKTTGGQVMAALAMGMGAIGAAFSKSERNPALEIIQSAIQDDIAAQRANIALGADGARNRLAAIERRVGDHRAADAAAEALAWQTVDHQISSLQAGAEGTAAAAQGDALRAQARQKQNEAWMRFKQWVPARATGPAAPTLDEYLKRRKLAAETDKTIADGKAGAGGGERKTAEERLGAALDEAGVTGMQDAANRVEELLNRMPSAAGWWDASKPGVFKSSDEQEMYGALLDMNVEYQRRLGKSENDAVTAAKAQMGDGSADHARVGVKRAREIANSTAGHIFDRFSPDVVQEYGARAAARRHAPKPKVEK